MNDKQNQKLEETEKLKEIPKWTRRYTQNRTIPFLVSMAIFLLLFLGISGLSYLAGRSHRSENILMYRFWTIFDVLAIAALLCLSVPKWGGKLIEQISNRLYGKEGVITLAPQIRTKKHKWLGLVIGLGSACCVVGSVQLGMHGYIPIEYMQPVSAPYIVPFLVFLIIWQKPMVGLLSLLWPILYALHAILVVAGVPIQFGENLQFLNVLIPVAGYGILCGLIGHIYSRFALKRLKDTAHIDKGTLTDAT